MKSTAETEQAAPAGAAALAGDEPPQFGLLRLLGMVLLPFALAHFISYLFRTVNAVVYPELAHDLGLEANNLGLLTSVYLLTFALAQLPVGVALDRFGPRRVQIPMLAVAAAGAAMFAGAHTLWMLVVARGLIGLGVAGSLMASIKACSLWLPPQKLSLATAIVLAVGGMGAMVATTPVQLALTYTDWRIVFLCLASVTVALSTAMFFMVPEHPKKQKTRLSDMTRAVAQLYSTWSFWRLAFYTLFAHASFMAIQGLWMGPWLHDVRHLSRLEVANVLFAGTVGMVVGSLAFGWLTDILHKRGFKPILVCGGGLACFLLIEVLMVLEVPVSPFVIAVGFSCFGSSAAMNYAIVAQSVPPHLIGRVSTSYNLVIFMLGFLVQWGLGSIINLWPMENGVYPAKAYQVALGINLALQIPGFLLWLSFKPWQRER